MGASHHIEPLEPRRLLAVPAGFSEVRIGPAIPRTTTMSLAPDGRIFVAQQDGMLRVIKQGQLLDAPFLSVTVDSAGERGLLAMTFDPAFEDNRFVYIGYTLKTPDGKTRNRISRFTRQQHESGRRRTRQRARAARPGPRRQLAVPQRRLAPLRPGREALRVGRRELPIQRGAEPLDHVGQDAPHQRRRLDPHRQPVLQPDDRA